MNRTWRTLGLTGMLTVALAACRARAQAGDPPKPDDPRQELEQFRSDTIHSFQAAQKDVAALREEVAHLRKDLEELRNARPPAVGVQGDPASGVEAAPGGASPAAQKEIDSLKEQVAPPLRQALADLRQSGDGISRYGPAGTGEELQAARKEVEELKDQVAQLRKTLDGLRVRGLLRAGPRITARLGTRPRRGRAASCC